MSETKVFLATIDKDLKIRSLKKYPLSKNGQQIYVTSGGEGHFMPVITNTSYLEFPQRSFPNFWKTSYRRIYFAMNKATKCVDFESGEVSMPSPEELKKANLQLLAGKIGQDTNKGIPWYIWGILGINVISFLLLLQLAGVIR